MLTYRILMIDDDEEDYIILKKALEKITDRHYTLDWMPTWEKERKVEVFNFYDIILIDYNLKVQTGIEIIKQASEAGLDAAFILLTGSDDPAADAAAQAAGAMDFLVKGTFTPKELDRSLRYSLSRFQDIAAIKDLNSILEERIRERTESLHHTVEELEKQVKANADAQAKVLKSLEKERELNEMKSNFVSMASHEFRTPLTSIASSADLVSMYAERHDMEKIKKHADRIKQSVENLTTILGEFLSLSRLEEGRTTAQPQPFDLQDLVRDIQEELKYAFKDRQVLQYNHLGTSLIVLDPHLLKNVLLNLVSNAIKYSPEKTTIWLESAVEDSKVKIKVRDQGIGISKEDQQNLFSRFFRAANTTHIQGTGLGLYIVKNYVKMMQGTIKYESELGKGSTFWVEFPQ